MKSKVLLMTLICLSSGAGFAQRIDSGVPGMLFEHNVAVTMSDGGIIRANIYRPDKPGRFPVLMLMGPYGKDTRYDEVPAYKTSWARIIAKYPELTKRSSCRYMRFEAPDPERWVPNGYIVIHADSRGTGASPGMLDPFSSREIEDYATLITWAAHQSWSNGKVGLLGTSYYAINQWLVAARQPEGLAAILPWEGAFDYYREIAFNGGIPNNLSWQFWWDHQVVTNQNGNGESPLVDIVSGQRSTGTVLTPDLLKQNRVSPNDAWHRNALDGAFFQERTADARRIVVPVFAVGNWEGWTAIEGFTKAASISKWLWIHPGDHLTPFYSEEALKLQKCFFDHFLKGDQNGWEHEAPVSLQIRGAEGTFFRKETAWPVKGTQWRRYYLDAGSGAMSPDKENPVSADSSYPALKDGVTFSTPAFDTDVELTGPVMLKLWVRSSTADMDIFAALRLIDPQGRDVTFNGNTNPRVPLDVAFLRVSQRALDSSASTSYQPRQSYQDKEPMVPGQVYEVELGFNYPLGNVIGKGYKLALTIQGKDWQYKPDANTVGSKDYELPNSHDPGLFFLEHPDRDPALYGGTYTLVTGNGHQSYLFLPFVSNAH
jgi:uncharacterized protein